MAEIDRDTMLISKLTPPDEKPYIDFLQRAYKDQFNRYRFESRHHIKEFWQWEYVKNPAEINGKPLIWICRIDENVVGQLCVMPVKLKIGNNVYNGGWCQDFMVLPEFRGIGIGQELVHKIKSELSNTLDIVMAIIATERSRALFRKQGFMEIGEIRKNITLRIISRILLSFRSFTSGKDIKIQEIEVFDPEFDNLWEDTSMKFNCLIKRDKEFLEWRFAPQPYWTYRTFIAKENNALKGYVVVKVRKYSETGRKSSDAGIISDIFFNPSEPHIGRALMQKALKIMKNKMPFGRCDVMNPSMQKFLGSTCFVDIRSDNMFLLYLSERVTKEDALLARKRDNWYISYGDSDLDFS